MGGVILVLIYILIPFLLLFLNNKVPILRKLGPVLMAYLLGIAIGNSGLLPENSAKIQDLMTTISVPLALPLLLFSSDIRSWFKMAGKTFLSLILGLVSIIIPIILGYFFFGSHIAENWKVAGMLTGVYTGGTPNLAAIAAALDVTPETYVLANGYDLVVGAFFILFVITIAQKLFQLVLPKFKSVKAAELGNIIYNEFQNNSGLLFYLKKDKILSVLKALGLGIIVFAIGAGLSFLVDKNSQMVVVILSITTLGILGSLVPTIKKTESNFDLGMFFILIFSLVVSSMADFSKFSLESVYLFYYIILAYVGSLIIHVGLAKIFRVDADNVIIVATALSCSPPFVPVVAAALKNKEIIISGITVGIIGYAIGNYLGIFIGYLLKSFPI